MSRYCSTGEGCLTMCMYVSTTLAEDQPALTLSLVLSAWLMLKILLNPRVLECRSSSSILFLRNSSSLLRSSSRCFNAYERKTNYDLSFTWKQNIALYDFSTRKSLLWMSICTSSSFLRTSSFLASDLELLCTSKITATPATWINR